ncbi:MAG: transglutaminase family protein [bacterium]|nr:transglutaminase family protein [bacterium]
MYSPNDPDSRAQANDPAACLAPGRFVDSDAPEVVAYAERAVGDARGEIEKARRLYLAVRDDLRYDPYRISSLPEEFRASRTLGRGYGFCVTKAAALAAVARAAGIPARLGFADVRNHLCTPKLRELMGGNDVFVFHGFTDFYLQGKWVKATPAFNRSLCEKARIPPLEFDGEHDSIFHPYDPAGRRHMEYLRIRGVYRDIPFQEMLACFIEAYGPEVMLRLAEASADDRRDFESELCHV